jgi:GTP-binding protein
MPLFQNAVYAASVATLDDPLPESEGEIAFAGRSNAGKSSAINALANRTRLAFTSKTPGRTQQINLFRLRSGALLADLPGYGYAAVPQALKRHWQEFLARYLATRQTLAGLVLVVDARHGLADLDRELLSGYVPSGRPTLVLATKIDKLTTNAARAAIAAIREALAAAFPLQAAQIAIVAFSSTRHTGISEAEHILGAWLGIDTSVPSARMRREAEKEKAPRSRGETRGPKTPGAGK